MPIYRLYVIDPDAHITVPPTLADCPDDDLAIAKAKQYLDGKAIEVWEGARGRGIGTRNTPSRSGPSLRQVGLNRSCCLRAART